MGRTLKRPDMAATYFCPLGQDREGGGTVALNSRLAVAGAAAASANTLMEGILAAAQALEDGAGMRGAAGGRTRGIPAV